LRASPEQPPTILASTIGTATRVRLIAPVLRSAVCVATTRYPGFLRRSRHRKRGVRWRKLGVEAPFRVRMGVNTGYCNVGNFGSSDRMDYTMLGAATKLAARLQSIAPAGGIVVSYETYALVRDIVAGHALAPVSMKGIAREVVPYEIDGLLDEGGNTLQVFSEHAAGLDLYLDLGRIDADAARNLRGVLHQAINALDEKV